MFFASLGLFCSLSPCTLCISFTGREELLSSRKFLLFVPWAAWAAWAAWAGWLGSLSGLGGWPLPGCLRPGLKEEVSWKITSSTSSSLKCWCTRWFFSLWLSSLFLPLRLAGLCWGPLRPLLRPLFFLFLNLILPLTKNFPAKQLWSGYIQEWYKIRHRFIAFSEARHWNTN